MAKKKPRAGKAPAYQWYPGDALADEAVATMTLEEEGAYRRLLDYHWREGSIPADPEELRRLCKWISPRRFAEIWSRIGARFAPAEHPGRLINQRAAAQREEAEAYRAEQKRKSDLGNAKLAESRKTDTPAGISAGVKSGTSPGVPEKTSGDPSAICDLRSASSSGSKEPEIAAGAATPAHEERRESDPPVAKRAARARPPRKSKAAQAPEPPPTLDTALETVPVKDILATIAAASGGRFVAPSEIAKQDWINVASYMKGRFMRDARTMGEYLAAGGLEWKGTLTLAAIAKKRDFFDLFDLAKAWSEAGRPDSKVKKAAPAFQRPDPARVVPPLFVDKPPPEMPATEEERRKLRQQLVAQALGQPPNNADDRGAA